MECFLKSILTHFSQNGSLNQVMCYLNYGARGRGRRRRRGNKKGGGTFGFRIGEKAVEKKNKKEI